MSTPGWIEFEEWNGSVGHHSGSAGEIAAEAFFAGFAAASQPIVSATDLQSSTANVSESASANNEQPLDPQPWLFISDQIFGEFRSDHDKGYHDVSGTYWAFSPRAEYEQDRSKYQPTESDPSAE